jgi:hypothetical protein
MNWERKNEGMDSIRVLCGVSASQVDALSLHERAYAGKIGRKKIKGVRGLGSFGRAY